MLNFDDIDDWAPKLGAALKQDVPSVIGTELVAAAPEYLEDAQDLLFKFADRDAVIDATLNWIRSTHVVGYHGSRLTDAEIASVRTIGLIPLKAETRRTRLIRALSPHPEWHVVQGRLDAIIQAHSHGAVLGVREGQVHLTLSKEGLTSDFNHYLRYGAEFDQHVADALLGPDAKQLLAQDGEPRVIQVAVPGAIALKAAHPYFGVDDLRKQGDVPNLVKEFLKAWTYRLAHPGFEPRTLQIDCGMMFHSPVPAAWIVMIDAWTP